MSVLSNSFIIFFAQVVFIAGFMIAFFVDHVPWSLRVAGKLIDKFPLSTLRSTQILMINRFGAAFCFTSAGFLVDIGTGLTSFLLFFAIAWGLLGMASLLYILQWEKVCKLLSVYLMGDETYKFSVKKVNFSLSYILLNYPFIFNMLGASLPIFSASVFPEYRGLLLQLGFVFNSVASILLVFVLEPKFMDHISKNQQDEADYYHQKFIISKTLLLFVFSVAGFILYFML